MLEGKETRLLQNAARFGFPSRLTGPDAAQLNLGSPGCNGLAAYPSVCAILAGYRGRPGPQGLRTTFHWVFWGFHEKYNIFM
jgi:hypothetical protein